MGIAVYEIKLKIYTLVDIPTEQLLGKEAAFIDSALGLDDQWIKYHEDNKYSYIPMICYIQSKKTVGI